MRASLFRVILSSLSLMAIFSPTFAQAEYPPGYPTPADIPLPTDTPAPAPSPSDPSVCSDITLAVSTVRGLREYTPPTVDTIYEGARCFNQSGNPICGCKLGPNGSQRPQYPPGTHPDNVSYLIDGRSASCVPDECTGKTAVTYSYTDCVLNSDRTSCSEQTVKKTINQVNCGPASKGTCPMKTVGYTSAKSGTCRFCKDLSGNPHCIADTESKSVTVDCSNVVTGDDGWKLDTNWICPGLGTSCSAQGQFGECSWIRYDAPNNCAAVQEMGTCADMPAVGQPGPIINAQ